MEIRITRRKRTIFIELYKIDNDRFDFSIFPARKRLDMKKKKQFKRRHHE